MVMVEITPQIELSSLSLGPVPGLLDFQIRTVHVGHVPSVCELCELGFWPEGGLAKVVSDLVAGDLDSSDWVSQSDNTSSPALIKGLIRVVIGSKVGVVIVEWTIVSPGSDDACDWKFLCAGSISELGIASVAGHSTDKAICLLGPNSCFEGQTLLIVVALAIVREVFYDGVGRCICAECYGHEQAHEYANLGC